MSYFIEVDEEKYLSEGEISVVGSPKTLDELFGDEFEKMPDKGFRIHRPEVLCKFVEAIGGKRGKAAAYILKHKDPRNILLTRVCDLATNAGVSLQTANDTLRLLRQTDSIKTINGALMVNPGVDHSGDRKRETYLMKVYQGFDSRKHSGDVSEGEDEEQS